MKFVSFKICGKSSGEEIFDCTDKYRSYDLKRISFDNDSLNVIVSSGDVGEIRYKYVDGCWHK